MINQSAEQFLEAGFNMMDEIKQWAERPDAFFAWMYCAAVGWV